MDDNGVGLEKICRFCGYEKNIGQFIFSPEAVRKGLLSKIKQLFPEEVRSIVLLYYEVKSKSDC